MRADWISFTGSRCEVLLGQNVHVRVYGVVKTYMYVSMVCSFWRGLRENIPRLHLFTTSFSRGSLSRRPVRGIRYRGLGTRLYCGCKSCLIILLCPSMWGFNGGFSKTVHAGNKGRKVFRLKGMYVMYRPLCKGSYMCSHTLTSRLEGLTMPIGYKYRRTASSDREKAGPRRNLTDVY